MPQLEFFLVCESASIDRESNRISLFNVMEELRPSQLPAPFPSLVAVSSWNTRPDELNSDHQAELRLTIPGAPDLPQPARINFTVSGQRQRVNFRVENLPVFQPGDLLFEVLLNGVHAASHRVTVLPPDPELLGGSQTLLFAEPPGSRGESEASAAEG